MMTVLRASRAHRAKPVRTVFVHSAALRRSHVLTQSLGPSSPIVVYRVRTPASSTPVEDGYQRQEHPVSRAQLVEHRTPRTQCATSVCQASSHLLALAATTAQSARSQIQLRLRLGRPIALHASTERTDIMKKQAEHLKCNHARHASLDSSPTTLLTDVNNVQQVRSATMAAPAFHATLACSLIWTKVVVKCVQMAMLASMVPARPVMLVRRITKIGAAAYLVRQDRRAPTAHAQCAGRGNNQPYHSLYHAKFAQLGEQGRGVRARLIVLPERSLILGAQHAKPVVLVNTAYRVTPATDARLLDIIHRMRSAASRVQMGRHRQLHALGVSSAQKEGLGQVASAPSVQLVVRPQQIDQRAISAHQMKRELEDYAQLALPESNQTMVRHPVKPVH
eukprot:SAG31_NODE_1197_length_9441_cov_5.823592_4_plen_393_part_00